MFIPGVDDRLAAESILLGVQDSLTQLAAGTVPLWPPTITMLAAAHAKALELMSSKPAPANASVPASPPAARAA